MIQKLEIFFTLLFVNLLFVCCVTNASTSNQTSDQSGEFMLMQLFSESNSYIKAERKKEYHFMYSKLINKVSVLKNFSANDFEAYFYTFTNENMRFLFGASMCNLLNGQDDDQKPAPEIYQQAIKIFFPDQKDCDFKPATAIIPNRAPFKMGESKDQSILMRIYPREITVNRPTDALHRDDANFQSLFLVCRFQSTIAMARCVDELLSEF